MRTLFIPKTITIKTIRTFRRTALKNETFRLPPPHLIQICKIPFCFCTWRRIIKRLCWKIKTKSQHCVCKCLKQHQNSWSQPSEPQRVMAKVNGKQLAKRIKMKQQGTGSTPSHSLLSLIVFSRNAWGHN